MTVPRSRWASLEPSINDGQPEPAEASGSASEIRPVPALGDLEGAGPEVVALAPGFGGTFVTDDAVLEGSLEFQGKRLVMWGGGTPLLAWEPGECLLERLTANRFVLSADGETITFTADDPEDLEASRYFSLYGPTPNRSSGRNASRVPERAFDDVGPQDDAFQPEPTVAKPVAAYAWKPVEDLAAFDAPQPGPTEPDPTEATPLDLDSPVPVSGDLLSSDHLSPDPVDLLPTEQLSPDRVTSEPAPSEIEPAPSEIEDVDPTPSFGVRRTYIKAVRPLRAVKDLEELAPDADDEDPENPEDLVEDDEDDEGATIADDAIIRARRTTSVRAARWWTTEVQAAAIKVGVVSGVVLVVMGFAFGIMLMMGGFQSRSSDLTAPSPTTSIVTVPTTTPNTEVTPSTVPLTTSVFALSGADFAERWNVLASDLDESLLLSPNLTNPFSLVLTPFITFDGVLDPAAGNLRLRAAPTGTAEGDRSILVALALVIGTAEPSLTPANRGQLLEALGLDPSNPQVGGINDVRTFNGRAYELIYLAEEGILQFTVRNGAAPSPGG